ncbi:acyltransferase [Actinomycetaceae bacterium TAE3-ERU4]|nr:acyltransferase [Actinomycetaceae bacterium TAE3-ERU4]
MEKRGGATRLDSLTGLRWWAAFGVFLYHLAPSGAVGLRNQAFFLAGDSGVAFFFVLSGFVLAWSARPHVGAKQFWWRRFARIWPAHFVALLLAIPVFYSFGSWGIEGSSANWWVKPADGNVFLVSALLLQGFFVSPSYVFGGNPAAWTLSCEALFYALFPALILLVRNWNKRTVVVATALLVCFSGAVLLGIGLPAALPPVLTQLWQFLLGVLVAMGLKRGIRMALSPQLVVAGLLFLFVLSGVVATGTLGEAAKKILHPLNVFGFPVIYGLAIFALASAELAGRNSFLRSRLLVKAGEWSYAFYLVHATVLYGWRELIGVPREVTIRGVYVSSSVMGFVTFCLLFVLCVAAAGALHTWVEKPCEKKIRAWADNRYGKSGRS